MTPPRPFIFAICRAVVLASSIALGVGAPSVLGQPKSVASQVQTYAIPAGPLGQVLSRFAAEAGILLTGDAALTDGLQSPGLQGSYSVAEGLRTLLTGTGLDYVRNSNGGYALRQVQSGSLPPVKISSSAISDGSAEMGYVSNTVSQVGPWRGRSLQDTPYSVLTMSSDFVESLQAISSDHIFRVNPTTQVTRLQFENDQTFVNIRGFTVSKFYRDGLPGGQYGQGTTTEDVEKIEVLSGLSGFMYGPGNVGGVVNFVSKRPTVERLNKLTAGNNGGANYYLHGDFGGYVDEENRFGYRINAVVQSGETAIEPMEVEKEFISGAFDWQITETLLLQLNIADRDYRLMGRQSPFFLSEGVSRPAASTFDSSVSYGQPWTEKALENERLGASVRWDATGYLTVRAAWARDKGVEGESFVRNTLNGDGTYRQQVFGQYPSGVDDILTDKSDTRSQIFADIRFDTGTISHTLTLGHQYSKDVQRRYDGEGAAPILYENLPLPGPNYVDRPQVSTPQDRGSKYVLLDAKNISWLLGDDIVFNERWSMLVGVAKAKIQNDKSWSGPYSDSELTPTVSLIYKPDNRLTIYANYVEALEQGGMAGEEFNGEPVVNSGELFPPLLSEQFEVGAKATVGGVSLTAALFEIEKGLQYYDTSEPGRPVYVQDGRQTHRGVEFTATGTIAKNWALISGFTALDAAVEKHRENPELEGNRPVNVPDYLAKLRSEYRVSAVSGLTLLAGISYESDRYADLQNRDRMRAYTLVDVGARYETELEGHALTLRAELRNATDKHYWVGNFSGLGEPRTLVFSASIEL